MGSALFDDINNPLLRDLCGDSVLSREDLSRDIAQLFGLVNVSEPLVAVDPGRVEYCGACGRFAQEDFDIVITPNVVMGRLRGRSAAWHIRWMSC